MGNSFTIDLIHSLAFKPCQYKAQKHNKIEIGKTMMIQHCVVVSCDRFNVTSFGFRDDI